MISINKNSEKLREHQYRKRYARSLEGKGVECDEDNVEHVGADETGNGKNCKKMCVAQ